ncbi:MAG: DUF3267 domain-containing protein [Clostridiales bacterium]|nr:DUF3267 domain-containing protein [Clostridiales bacterium]
MDRSNLSETKYRTHKHSMSFLKANVVSLLYPLPLAVLYIGAALAVSGARAAALPDGEVFVSSLDSMMKNPFVFLLFYIVSLFVLVVLHELTHAFLFLRGCEHGWKSIKFGVKAFTPYCHCKEAVTVSIARQSCLGPLWSVCLPLAILSFFVGSFWLSLITVVMIFGSGADIWIVIKMRHYDGKKCYAWDMEEEVGMIVYEPIEGARSESAISDPDRTSTETADVSVVPEDSSPDGTDGSAEA